MQGCITRLQLGFVYCLTNRYVTNINKCSTLAVKYSQMNKTIDGWVCVHLKTNFRLHCCHSIKLCSKHGETFAVMLHQRMAPRSNSCNSACQHSGTSCRIGNIYVLFSMNVSADIYFTSVLGNSRLILPRWHVFYIWRVPTYLGVCSGGMQIIYIKKLFRWYCIFCFHKLQSLTLFIRKLNFRLGICFNKTIFDF